MSQKPRSLKVKVIIGYLLLFVIAALSVWFIYSEILKIATPSNNANADSQKVIRVSNAIASLYASETVGRNSILTGSKADLNEYTKLLDSIKLEIEAIKSEADKTQLPKLDTIQYLLQRKKNSINEIIEFRKYLDTRATYKRAERKVYYTKDSLVKKIKPVQFSGRQQYRSFLNEVLTKKQLDSLSKLPLSNDSLTMAIQGAIRKEASREIDKQYELVGKEQKMLDENRYISDQLRTVLSSLEKQMLEKSYAKINESKRAIDNTIQTIAWVGAITFCLLIVFGYIIIRDLTINQNYRNQLEALNAEKEDLLRSKMMLLATVTHDIQTPLGSVIGFSDLLKNTDVNP